MQWILELAADCGFSHAAPLDPSTLVFRQEVRDMCVSGRCQNYGKSWSCPPACGTLEEARRLAAGFPYGVLVQTTGALDDDFDYEGMVDAERRHKEALARFADMLLGRCERILPMGAGGCRLCSVCTYPDAPCRFPQRMIVSMEAYGLLVSQVCEGCGIPYSYGPKTITYVSCVLYR